MKKLYWAWSFYVGPVLTLPLLALIWTWRSRRTRILLFLAALRSFHASLFFYELKRRLP